VHNLESQCCQPPPASEGRRVALKCRCQLLPSSLPKPAGLLLCREKADVMSISSVCKDIAMLYVFEH
jgi:hypothetical protein